MKETAPVWSMRGRSTYTHKEAVPGPGAYSPTNSMMYTSPNYRVGTAPRKSLAELSITPGPGTYSPSITADTPKWSILGKIRKSTPERVIDTPGPGAYRIAQTQESPRYSVGKSLRTSSEFGNKMPGPGTYNPQLIGFKGNNLFGRAQRTGMGNSSNVPGPGVYEYKSLISEGPRFTFRPRLKSAEKYNVPGPGNYNPNHSTVLEKAPIWGTRGSYRGQDLSPMKNNPGPGTYLKNSTLAGPKWVFGSTKRGKSTVNMSPGPGTYEIKSTIGGVPSYVQAGSKL